MTNITEAATMIRNVQNSLTLFSSLVLILNSLISPSDIDAVVEDDPATLSFPNCPIIAIGERVFSGISALLDFLASLLAPDFSVKKNKADNMLHT